METTIIGILLSVQRRQLESRLRRRSAIYIGSQMSSRP